MFVLKWLELCFVLALLQNKGTCILEGLAATGLRSLRYALEVSVEVNRSAWLLAGLMCHVTTLPVVLPG